ncbi:MAG: glycosyltransferase family 4 protein [Candidatus Eremiobacteraeota bacterium]|nr:glycosyltransferase family 4 protein [Candidatus Eremiobacteraeota bacterium]MBC5827650.1 glycosyltransferase family 4 protein [Candidatus Eremiobacteraeota bacterium]
MTALRIGVDAWNLPHDRRGIGRYVRAILRRWLATDRERVKVTLLIPQRPAWLYKAPYVKALGGAAVSVLSRQAAARPIFDAVWFPWNGMSWRCPGRKVATLHDASVFALPSAQERERRQAQEPFVKAAAEADRILTDSYFSKAELVKYLLIVPERVSVVPLGVDMPLTKPSTEGATRRGDGARYILFVGEPDERKGLDTLLGAMAMLPSDLRAGIQLILVGRVPPDKRIGTNLEVEVSVRGHVSDGELASLYRGAAALVYPSRYEGFGLPVLEAMAHGTPVVASDSGGVREAGGDAALYFPAGDVPELSRAIARVLEDGELARKLRRAGSRHAAGMTWEATATATLRVFETLVGARSAKRNPLEAAESSQ